MSGICDPIAAVTHPDPYPYYAALRARPFQRDQRLGLWVAASAAAITEVLENTDCGVRPLAEPVPLALADKALGQVFGRLVRQTDGPAQARVKRVLAAALAGVEARQVADIARWQAAMLGEGDLDALIFQLPVRSVAALLGVPAVDLARVADLTGDFVRAMAPAGSPEAISAGEAAIAVLLRDFAGWSAVPGPGLLQRLHRDGVGEGEAILANAIGLLSQTYDATAGLLGNGLIALARHPDIAVRAAADPALYPRIVAEVLRLDPPVQNTRRFVHRDTVIAGRNLAAGDAILLVLAAANRDPDANQNPENFDITRNCPATFTFGAGRHACPGSAIAQTIAAIGLESLAPRAATLPTRIAYRPLANARIPRFDGTA